jgi:hypothetical protein
MFTADLDCMLNLGGREGNICMIIAGACSRGGELRYCSGSDSE